MPRQVGEIREGNIRPAARPGDFYNRPAVAPEGRLEKIAAAYNAIGVNLGGYLEAKKNAAIDRDMATGVKLYQGLIAKGHSSNMTLDDVEKLVSESKTEAFPKLTRWVKQGVIKAHYEAVAGAAFDEVTKQFATMTTTDANGNTIPLSESNDPVKIQDAFTRLWHGYMQQRTGGQYDARLYQEYIAPKERQVYNAYLNYTAGENAKRLVQQQKNALVQNMDNSFTELAKTGRFTMDEAGATAEIAQIWQSRIEEGMQSGMSRIDAVAAALEYIEAKMEDPNIPYDYIAYLHEAAMQIPDFANDAATVMRLNARLNTAEYHADSRIRRADQRERDSYRDISYPFLYDWLNGDRNPETFNAFIEQIPLKYRRDVVSIANDIQNWSTYADELMIEMPPEEYAALMQQAWEGRLDFSTIASYGAQRHGSNTQLRALAAVANSVESHIRQQRNDTKSDYETSTKQFQRDLTWAISVIGDISGVKPDSADAMANANLMQAIYAQALPLVNKIQDDRRNGVNLFSTNMALAEMAGQAGTLLNQHRGYYEDNPEGRYLEGDELTRASAEYTYNGLVQNNLSREGADMLDRALEAGATPAQVEKILRDNPNPKLSDYKNVTPNLKKIAADIINNYKLKESKAGEPAE